MFHQLKWLLLEPSKLRQTLSNTKTVHAFVIKTYLSRDPFYATQIVRLYAINGDIISARNVFDQSPYRSLYLWNSIIRAYARAHKFSNAFLLFVQMLRAETKPDNFTYACILRACSENFDIQRLRLVHGGLVASGLGLDSVCSSALVTAYGKVGLIDDACRVFCAITEPDLVLWNSMISGYGISGDWENGLYMFSKMRSMGKKPDGYTLVGVVSGLIDPNLLEIVQGIHGICLKCGFDSSVHVGSVLVSTYSRFKCMNSACRVFESLHQPDLVTWSALITGFSQFGDSGKALFFFKKMNLEGVRADPVLLASLLASSAQSAIVGPGLEIHSYAVRHNFDSHIMVSSALVDMYSKCGFIQFGIRVFKNMQRKNTISYNSMISSLGFYGLAHDAIELFDEMVNKGLRPDESTLSALLSACLHAGLVNEGREYFKRMKFEFEIEAKTEHYIHIVKLLGTAGQLEEAYDLIKVFQEPMVSSVWGALLSCCDLHNNSVMAKIVAEKILLETKQENHNYKVMISNIYAGDGRWDDAEKMRNNMVGRGTGKLPGLSWIGCT